MHSIHCAKAVSRSFGDASNHSTVKVSRPKSSAATRVATARPQKERAPIHR